MEKQKKMVNASECFIAVNFDNIMEDFHLETSENTCRRHFKILY
jgi:hypothetical protein